MAILLVFAIVSGLLLMLALGGLVGRGDSLQALARKTNAQGWAIFCLVAVTIAAWMPLFQRTPDPAVRGCGLEGFFLILVPILLSASLLGAVPVWLSNFWKLREKHQSSTPMNMDPQSEWKVVR